jgi:hypothetical protein
MLSGAQMHWLALRGTLCHDVRTTLAEQVEGWKQRPLFERQWVGRDFKRHAGMSVEQRPASLERLEHCLEQGDLDTVATLSVPIDALARY